MRKIFAVLAAAATLAYAAPSYAAGGINGYYLATFKTPSGSFQHCFQLKAAAGTVAGYKVSGTWVDTDFPNTAGQFVIYKGALHLAGYVSDPNETDYLTIDGQINAGTIQHATFDYFAPTGLYIAAGSVTEMKNSGCQS